MNQYELDIFREKISSKCTTMQQRIFRIFDILQHESHKYYSLIFTVKYIQHNQFACHFQTLLNDLEIFFKNLAQKRERTSEKKEG